MGNNEEIKIQEVELKLSGQPDIGLEGVAEINGYGNKLPVKQGFWQKVKSILFYEIKVELTPHQQKIEDEINEFLHQEITWKKVKNFLFKEIKF